ncbi:hypothetical protein [Lysobacter sp. CA196]|uniref:hypothetical protein n=1 Tax=Lysobacter sp. CA196 TaxID=3455606 RepID=UPI003F8D731B
MAAARRASIRLKLLAGLALSALSAASLAQSDRVAQNQQRYAEVLRVAIDEQWAPPATTPADASCSVDLRQAPGGRVLSVQVIEPCGLDEAGRLSLLAAARQASPLPYQGYQQVFRPQIRLSFRVQDEDPVVTKPRRWWKRLRER